MKHFPRLRLIGCIVVTVTCFLVACSGSDASEDKVFTLYHNLEEYETVRIHVATFDANREPTEVSESFNRSYCEQAQGFFQNELRPGTKTKFWCEKGRFKK